MKLQVLFFGVGLVLENQLEDAPSDMTIIP
jgi:hypothetical protein